MWVLPKLLLSPLTNFEFSLMLIQAGLTYSQAGLTLIEASLTLSPSVHNDNL